MLTIGGDELISKAKLLKAGYREYTANDSAFHSRLFQKCIRTRTKKLYFIDVYYYEIIEVNMKGVCPFEAKVQFNTNTSETFDVAMHINNTTTIGEIEAFFAEVYGKMQCKPYEVL